MQNRGLLPSSTMKDDFRWYNTLLFEQKNKILADNPELAPQVYNNKSLKPFLDQPLHMTKKQSLIQQASFVNHQQQTIDSNIKLQDGSHPRGKRN